MNTEFLFDNIVYFPLLAVVVAVVYLIQFCSVISPCQIEFNEESKSEMTIMERYNMLSENAFSIYIGCVLAGVAVALVLSSSIILLMLMIVQLIYIIPAGIIMFLMYERSIKYWERYGRGEMRKDKKSLTLNKAQIYN